MFRRKESYSLYYLYHELIKEGGDDQGTDYVDLFITGDPHRHQQGEGGHL